jgi:predicted DNA-binding transcriptional regulator YafY
VSGTVRPTGANEVASGSRFTGWAARLVSERRWHPSQQIEWKGKQADELVMTLELSSFEEIRRWILSWGPQVEVLSPPELRTEILEALTTTKKLYHGSSHAKLD